MKAVCVWSYCFSTQLHGQIFTYPDTYSVYGILPLLGLHQGISITITTEYGMDVNISVV